VTRSRARPRFERTDLSSLAEAVQEVVVGFERLTSQNKTSGALLLQSIEGSLKTLKTELEASIGEKVEETIQAQEITLPLSMTLRGRKKDETPADPVEGIRGLMG
jgi:hypothetical protein